MADEINKLPEINPEVSIRPNSNNIPKELLEQITAQARIEQEARYKDKLSSAQRNYEQKLANLQNEIIFEKEIKPSIQSEYIKNGGKTEYFNDFFNLHNGKFTSSDKIKDTLLEAKKATPWAFQEQSSVSAQVGKGLGNNGVVNNSERYPQTIYSVKPNTRK